MTHSICPSCNFYNLSGNSICANCGVSLDRRAVVMRPDNNIIVPGRQLPTRQLKRLGASIVVSAIALLAEVSFLYLRRRLRDVDMPRLRPKRKNRLPVSIDTQLTKPATTGKSVVSVYSERIVEERRWGRPVRRVVDRMAWRSEQTIET